MFYTEMSCPACSNTFGGRPFALSGKMGPTEFRCRGCGHVMQSGKDEWPRLNAGRRMWFLIASLIYAAIIGGMYLLVIAAIYRSVNGDWPTTPIGVGIAVGIGAVVLMLQGVRVWRSIERASREEGAPATVSFLSIEANGLTLALLPVVVFLIVWGLISKIAGG